MSPEEQLLLKCAAIIGHSFRMDLLQHLLPSWDEHKLLQALRALVDIHVLRWCNESQKLPAEPTSVAFSVEIIEKNEEEKKKSGEEKLVPCSQARTESLRWASRRSSWSGDGICVEKEHQYHISRV